MGYDAIGKRLANDGVIILDGGTGTELERRGVPMAAEAWCGAASVDHFDVLVEIHKDYMRAGAEIITTNTYASNRLVLAAAGLADAFADLNTSAVAAAHRARDELNREDVLIAGCLSHMCPVAPGTSAYDPDRMPSEQEMADAFGELAELHKAEGCDLIILEMMYCTYRMPKVFAAAKATGLPVWAGFSARVAEDGTLLSFDQVKDVALSEPLAMLAGFDFDVEAAGIMHTPSNTTGEALTLLGSYFDGPLMAYPDSGYFKMPEWRFDEIIPPFDLRDFAEGWLRQGVQVVGGCCGLSPEHIEALADLRR